MNRKTKRILPILQTKEYCLATKKNQVVTHAVCTVLSHSVVSNSLSPMDCSPPGSSVHGDPPGKNTGVGCHACLQGIFPIQGWNPGLLYCRRILYRLSHQGSLVTDNIIILSTTTTIIISTTIKVTFIEHLCVFVSASLLGTKDTVDGNKIPTFREGTF